MQITHHTHPDYLELELCGRLDANWAEHVSGVLDTAVRTGSHHIQLNLTRVDYLSSAGIRVLLKHYKQLKSVNGLLRIVQPSQGVLSIIKLAGLEALLLGAPPQVLQESSGPAKSQRVEVDGVILDSYEQHPGAILSYSFVGEPEKLLNGGFGETDCHRLAFKADMIGLGLGAFGKDFADCRGRFGEFLAAAGGAITQPTDGSSVPDYVIAEAQFLPEVNALYALTVSGRFAHLLRFETKSDAAKTIKFSELLQAVLQTLKIDAAGLVILAESAGLVGAALRRSPGTAADGLSPLAFPAVRDWLSFTTERNDERNLVLIVGIVAKDLKSDFASFLRPMASGSASQGHFHAAVFPYRPVQKGNLDLAQSVASLLGTESAQAVVHLLADDREFEGVGQTELMRGACWIGPIKSQPL